MHLTVHKRSVSHSKHWSVPENEAVSLWVKPGPLYILSQGRSVG